jgi:hypothetical protein
MLDRISKLYQNESLLRYLIAVCGVLLVASVVVLAWSLRTWRTDETQLAAIGALPSLTAETGNLPPARMQDIAKQSGKLYAGVTIEAPPPSDIIKVSVTSTSDYGLWQQAVFGVIKAAPDAVWKVRRICAADCAAGGLVVELTAHRFQLNFK